MRKLHHNNQGFSTIEVLLIIVILSIILGTGAYVFHAQQNASKNLVVSTSSTQTRSSQSKLTYLVIKEWRVKFVINDPVVAGAIYTPPITLPDGNQEIKLGSSVWRSLSCQGTNTTLDLNSTNLTSSIGDDLIRGTDQAKVLNDQVISPTNVVKVGDYYYTYQNNTGIGACMLSPAAGKTYQSINSAYSSNWMAHKVVAE